MNSTCSFQEELILSFLKSFQKTEEERKLPHSFYKANATVIPKAVEDTTKKENNRLISLMNKDVKILTKY